jgi:predicted transposase/invertase (TIGR01784 family)
MSKLTYCGLNDVYFKKLLKENKELLPRLLKWICNIDVTYDEIVMQNVEIQDEVKLRTTRFDIAIKVCNLRIDLESENQSHGDLEYYNNRKLYYLSRLHSQSYDKIDYNQMNKSYVIFLYNFNMGYDNLITESVMYNKTAGIEYPHLKIYDINLSKVNKSSTIELERLFDLLKSRDIDKYLGLSDPFLKGVANMIEEYDKDELLRLQAQLRRDNEIELRSMKEYAKRTGHEEGLAEGRAEGRAQGLTEGRAQGLTEGRAEGEKAKAIEMAKNLLSLGVDINTISKASGLSVDELKKL